MANKDIQQQHYENAENSRYSFDFKLDLSLLNILRSFSHKDHEFQEGYLESIYALLYYYQGKPETELFSEYCSQHGNHSVEALIFQVHYYVASLANLQVLIKALGIDETKLTSLSKSDINKTNILSVHAINDRIGKVNSALLVQKSQTLKPEYIDLTVSITTQEDEQQGILQIDYAKIAMAIQAKGKLDPYAASHIAHQLNKKFNVQLYHILFTFSDKQVQLTENNNERFEVIFKGVKYFTFRKDRFHEFRDRLVKLSFGDVEKNLDEITRLLSDIDAEVSKSIIARDLRSNHYLEKLLIGLLGNPIQLIRDQAVICLNILYDGVDWQKRAPYKPKISKVGSKFVITYLFEWDQSWNLQSLILLLKSYISDPGCQQNIVSWHKPRLREYHQQGDRKYIAFTMDFGRFKRCGFYDWKLVRMTQSGKLQSISKIVNLDMVQSSTELADLALMESKPIQGRFIVHPKDSRQLQIHEIYVDLLDAKPDQSGKFTKRGNFRKLKERLPDFQKQGINCLYVMGVLERDNGYQLDAKTHQKVFKRPDVSPLAITCRLTPNTMLGGKEEFTQMMNTANSIKMRIIIDSVTRVSSSRPHKKYKKHIVQRLDDHQKLVGMFGTDGRSLNFEDTFVLNYRKKKLWDMLLEELTAFSEQFKISGINLDNGQAWPQIFTLDAEEMYRQECDGMNAYNIKQIFNGEVCLQNEDCGYWGSSVKSTYPNPFLIKLTKRMWGKFPNFLIVGETWGAMGENDEREINIIQSGAIPRLFKLPIAIASIFGEHLRKDGTISKVERKNVHVIKKWIEYSNKLYPKGSILVQSTTYHAWPYPALIFKRGTWAAIDLFFFLPDIPMTFMGEEEGYAFREKTTNVFSYVTKQETIEVQLNDPTLQKAPQQRTMKRMDSYVHSSDLGFGYNTFTHQISIAQQSPEKPKQQMAPRVQSGTSLSQMAISNIESAQENFRREVGPQFGFDLKQIGKHYKHRRELRKQHKVLRNGQMVSLSAEHMYGWHTHVIAFARYSKEEVALVAINFNDGGVDMFVNLTGLKYYFPNSENSDVVVKLSDWNKPEEDDELGSYYFIGEFLQDRLICHLKNFQTRIWGVEIFTQNEEKKQLAVQSSKYRLLQKLNNTIPQTIYGNDWTKQLVLLADKCKSVQQFVNGFAYFYNRIIEPNQIDLNKLISQMNVFQQNRPLLCQLFAQFQSVLKLQGDDIAKIPFYDSLQQLVSHNKLGPIVFCTPELGKWTTTGGLGVMVDELTQELAKMNEEIYIITPYYHKNKKGETGYLAADGFKHTMNIEVWFNGQKAVIGITEGTVNRVKIFWLHNEEFFPLAYCGEDALYVIKQLTVYAKGCLELLCQLKLFPSVIVTNDWFCGLIPAYIKVRRYGDCFNNTRTFHICHNLDPLYEGRLYPKPQDGTLEYIHDLPKEFLIDPFWETLVINPSRCPLLTCNNWGTVSESYKYELLETSPLASVLRRYPNPFAFPNGIRREARFKVIMDKTKNDHLWAKEQLQKKYFGCQKLEDHIPVFGFVGRVTKQKGVHLILEVAEELIRSSHGQVMILVGGPADMREEYSAHCANEMQRLKHIFPRNFWADPSAFFMDGTVVNVGCDFGLMPSLFEPGGIVQHEFFIGSTPVIAYKTGGLKDTVHEFDTKQLKGSGFTFEKYNKGDFSYSIHRAIEIYQNPSFYQQLRKNAFEAAIDVADVGRAWAKEYYRLFEKNFIDKELVEEMMHTLQNDFVELKEELLFTKESGRVYKHEDKTNKDFEKILVAAKRSNLIQHQFFYRTQKIPSPRIIYLSGSFDEWKEKHKLKFDHFSKVWNISLQLRPGEYFYKFLVDGEWVCSDEDLKDNDIYGNINNFVIIQ